MNHLDTFDTLGDVRQSADPRHMNAAALTERDDRIEGILRAIRVAGGDREAAISAGHRALARAVTSK